MAELQTFCATFFYCLLALTVFVKQGPIVMLASNIAITTNRVPNYCF